MMIMPQKNIANAAGYAALLKPIEKALPALKGMKWPEASLKEFPYEGVGSWHEPPNAQGEFASYQWSKKTTLLGEGYKFGPAAEGASKDPLFHYIVDDFSVCPALAPYAGINWDALPAGSRELLTSMIASGRMRVKAFLREHPVLVARLPYIGHIQMSPQNADTVAMVYEEGMQWSIEEALSPKLPHEHCSDDKGNFFLLGLHPKVKFDIRDATEEDQDECSLSELLDAEIGHCMSYRKFKKMLLHIGIQFAPSGSNHIKITNPENGGMTTIQDRLTRGKTNDVDAFMAKSIFKQVRITPEQEQSLKDYLLGKKTTSKTCEKTPQTAA